MKVISLETMKVSLMIMGIFIKIVSYGGNGLVFQYVSGVVIFNFK